MPSTLRVQYETLKTVSPAQWGEMVKKQPAEEVHAGDLNLLGKIARQCSFEDFTAFVEANEIPSVQLTSEEMERLKGGKGGKFWAGLSKVLLFLSKVAGALSTAVAASEETESGTEEGSAGPNTPDCDGCV